MFNRLLYLCNKMTLQSHGFFGVFFYVSHIFCSKSCGIERWKGRKEKNQSCLKIQNTSNYYTESDGVWNMLPWNMATWHTEYFKLKGLEKWQVQENLSDLLFSPEACESASLYLEKRCLLISKDEGMPRNRHYCLPSFLPLAQTLLCYIFPWLSILPQT